MPPALGRENGAVFKEVPGGCSASGPDICPKWQYCNTSSNRCEPCAICDGTAKVTNSRCAGPLGCRKGRTIECPDLVATIPGQDGTPETYYRGFAGTTVEYMCPTKSNARLRCVLNETTLKAKWEGTFGCLTETSNREVLKTTVPVSHGTTPNPEMIPETTRVLIPAVIGGCVGVLLVIVIVVIAAFVFTTRTKKGALQAYSSESKNRTSEAVQNSQRGVEHTINNWASVASIESFVENDGSSSISVNLIMSPDVRHVGGESTSPEQTFPKTVDGVSLHHSEGSTPTVGGGGVRCLYEPDTDDSETQPLRQWSPDGVHDRRSQAALPTPTEHSWAESVTDVEAVDVHTAFSDGSRSYGPPRFRDYGQIYSRYPSPYDDQTETERLPDQRGHDSNDDSLLTRTYCSSFSASEATRLTAQEPPVNNESEDSGILAQPRRTPVEHCMDQVH